MGQRGPLPKPKLVVDHPASKAVEAKRLPPPSAGGITKKNLGGDLAPKAREVWNEIRELDHPVLEGCDVMVLGRYCVMLALWRELWSELSTKGLSYSHESRYQDESKRLHPEVGVAQNLSKDMMALEKVLGLTPDARLRLPSSKAKTPSADDAARAAFNNRV